MKITLVKNNANIFFDSWNCMVYSKYLYLSTIFV